MLFWPLNPIYTQIPNSLTSITQGQTKFPSSLTTISGFLNRCSFDLSTRFVLEFRLPDLDYSRSDQVSITIGHYKRLLKTMFFLPLNPRMTHIRTPWPRLSRVRPSFNHCWSSLRVSKTDVLLTPNANKHTHTQPIFFHMTLLTVEGIYVIMCKMTYILAIFLYTYPIFLCLTTISTWWLLFFFLFCSIH